MKKIFVTVVAVLVLLSGTANVSAAGLEDVFSAQYYADRYPDLKAAFGTDEAMLFQHFLDYGVKEGRNMSPVLDVAYYREKYEDLDKAFGDNWDAYVDHYFTYGINEGRDNGTDFNPKLYLESYEDLQAAFGGDYEKAIEHYLVFGIKEGRTKGLKSMQTAGETAAEEEAGSETDASSEKIEEEQETVSLAGPDAAEGEETQWETTLDEETQKLLEKTTITAEKVDSIAYANVESRMREKNLTVLALQENVDMLESIDYEEMEDDLRDLLNMTADGQWLMSMAGSLPQGHPDYLAPDSFAHTQTQQIYNGLRQQFDAVHNGDLQEDNAGAMRQVRNIQDQVIMGGEMLYVTLAGLDIQEAALQRQLAALNRTVEEMNLRYNLGQISALQLSEVKAGQTALVSGLETLRMNIRNYKAQFQMMLGAEMTGQLQLGIVPEVTEKQLADMDVERDLLAAKTKSYELYAAAKTLEDEQETYKEAGKNYGYKEEKLEFRKAKHTWQAAQYTYNDTLRNYELKFRNLYAQVLDYKQILESAKVSLESEKLSFAASELKYQQGTLSKNAYLTAQDDLLAAEDAVQTAANDLFASYNTYCWAVQHGILN